MALPPPYKNSTKKGNSYTKSGHFPDKTGGGAVSPKQAPYTKGGHFATGDAIKDPAVKNAHYHGMPGNVVQSGGPVNSTSTAKGKGDVPMPAKARSRRLKKRGSYSTQAMGKLLGKTTTGNKN